MWSYKFHPNASICLNPLKLKSNRSFTLHFTFVTERLPNNMISICFAFCLVKFVRWCCIIAPICIIIIIKSSEHTPQPRQSLAKHRQIYIHYRLFCFYNGYVNVPISSSDTSQTNICPVPFVATLLKWFSVGQLFLF